MMKTYTYQKWGSNQRSNFN